MADGKQSSSDKADRKPPSKEELERRHQQDLEIEDERSALEKAREQNAEAIQSDEGGSGYGNLHYGDGPEGDIEKGEPSKQGAASGAELQDGLRGPVSLQEDETDGSTEQSRGEDSGGEDAPADDGLVEPTLIPQSENGPVQTQSDGLHIGTPAVGENVVSSASASENAPVIFGLDVNRTDANEAPTEIELSNDAINENESGAVVAVLSAVDADSNDTATYSIVGDASDAFEIVGNELRLKEGVSLDYETQDTYELTLEVTDASGAIFQKTVSINVVDVNEAPDDLKLSNASVGENAAGAVIGDLSLSDVDAGDSYIFAVSDDRFEVVDGQLKLKDGVTLDHEEADSIDVTVTATDSGGLSTDATFAIAVGDVNEAPDDLKLSNASVGENAAGAVIGDLSLTDVDADDSHTFAVSDNRFEVVDGQLKLKEGVTLDHEEADSIDVTVTATDSGGLSTDATFAIAVGDVNEAPDDLKLSNANVAENAAGAVIGDLSLSDVDDGDGHTFAVSDDRFEVVDGQLKLKEGVTLDHEEADSIDVMVTATDSGGLSTDATFAIAVGDVNEAPDDLKLSNASVGENAAGAVIGDLSLTDADAGDSHTFMVSDDRFEVVDGQLKLKEGVTLDHEEADSTDVTVTATDSGGLSTDATFAIAVGDVNEAPTDILLSNNTVSENDPGAVVATLSASDPDIGDSASFVIVDDPSGAFEVVGDQLKLKDGVTLNYEDADTRNIMIEVTDSGGETYREGVTVNVENVNFAPTLGLAGSEGLAASYYDVGRSIRNLDEIDFDGDPDATAVVANLDYMTGNETFWDGGPDNYFAAKYEGQLVVGEAGSYTINLASDDGSMLFVDGVAVLDNDGLHGTRTRSVTLDLDEGAHEVEVRYFENGGRQTLQMTWSGPDTGGATELVDGASFYNGALPDSLSVSEDTPGAVVATLAVSDPDAGDTFTFAVSDDRFEVAEVDGEPVLKLKDGVSIDHETEGSVDVSVTVFDAAGESDKADFSIAVADDNSAPTLSVANTEGLVASYYDVGRSIRNLDEVDFDADPDATGVVANLDYMTGNEAFWEGGPDNYFAAKYEGQLVVDEAGSYTVNLASDDGSVLFVDGVAVLDNDGLHGTRTRSVTLELDEGPHEIEVRYFENGGAQTLQMSWSGPDTGGATQLIDGTALAQPGAFDVENTSVTENVDGDIAVFLSAVDAEGDAISFGVSDDRFEVVETDDGLALKLKSGEALDYETEQQVDVVVTATDEHGESASETFTITVADIDEGPPPIIGTPGNDRLRGTNNDDVIDGLAGNDIISGRGGDDVIIGGEGNDRLYGGSGDDTFVVTGDNQGFDRVIGGRGDDTIVAGADDTTIGLNNFGNWVETISSGGFDNVTIEGTAGNNTLNFSRTDLDGIDAIDAGAGNDRVIGSAGDDTIVGGTGNDRLSGGAGDDTFVISGQNDGFDRFSGGAGNDQIVAGSDDTSIGLAYFNNSVETISADGNDGVTIVGTAGNNRLNFSSTELDGIEAIDVGAGNDRVTGSAGDDTIIGGAGNDRLSGGDGDDTFVINGASDGFDRFSGGAGIDQIVAGSDDTSIGLAYFNNSVETISSDGNEGVNIVGTAGNNSLNFSRTELDGIETIDVGAGNDRVTGSAGDDTIIGGAGNDRLSGGAGDDTFVINGASDGFDRFSGGAGNDQIVAGSDDTSIGLAYFNNSVETISADGNDGVNIVGTAGNNRLNFSRTELDGIETIDVGAGNDRVTGSAGDDVIIGGAGNDRLSGGDGDDTFIINGTSDGFDRFSGGAGDDQILAGSDDTSIGLAYFNNSVETISADDNDGVNIVGTAGNNWLNFSRTDLEGIDMIDAGAGNDRVVGSDDDDVIIGGEGNDRLSGGEGDDTFVITGQNDGFDRFSGGAGDDQILAGSDDTSIGLAYFNNSVETISSDGNDGVTIVGTAGNNTLNFSRTELDGIDVIDAGAGNDRVIGSDGDDNIIGGAGNDRLYGGLGDDTFLGGEGNDLVNGGAGADVFVYEMGDGSDQFNAGGGAWTDTIQFSDGVGSLGELGVDWTIDLTQGSITSSSEDGIELSDGADGIITLDDGSTIAFTDVEQII
jgi:Ca2+-binding RTX toxin-like protein